MEVEYTGLTRDTKEKFYTKDEVVKLCYGHLRKLKLINKQDLIIEPSAGNGAFIKYIKRLSNNYRFYDIEPASIDVVTQDFFTLQMEHDIETRLHFFGNPPFGRQSSIARRFIKRCCAMNADTIAFILPRSFKKPSFQRCFDSHYHLISELDIPRHAFLINEKSHDVSCVFQVWIKKTHNRVNAELIQPTHYEFVKHDGEPDISVRRVGVYAGKVDVDCIKSVQSHYFIKFHNTVDKSIIIDAMKDMVFSESDNTVGPRSISKPELIHKLNNIISSIYS